MLRIYASVFLSLFVNIFPINGIVNIFNNVARMEFYKWKCNVISKKSSRIAVN
jgi:hypothetical protein